MLHISLELAKAGDLGLKVSDMLGRVVIEENLSGVPGRNNFDLNLKGNQKACTCLNEIE
jgi:hypothetical protein